MRLSEKLRRENIKLWSKILNHPFIVEVAQAKLPIEKFTYYIAQDSIYLDGLLRSMAYIAAKAPSRELIRFFAELIIETIEGEIAMQNKIKSIIEVKRIPANITNKRYIEYLIAAGRDGSFWESVAAITPCFWTYELIGDKLRNTMATKNKLFKIWVEEYTSKEYKDIVNRLRMILDEAEDKEDLEKIRRHFKKASEFEFQFWETAYSMMRY